MGASLARLLRGPRERLPGGPGYFEHRKHAATLEWNLLAWYVRFFEPENSSLVQFEPCPRTSQTLVPRSILAT